MTFRLGKTSEVTLVGVTAPLVEAVRYAIEQTAVDFSVFEGVRTLERQKKLFASGASATLNSYHLTGEAVDLVPYLDGRLQWQAPLCYKVAAAMREASIVKGVPLIWGGVWDRRLASLDPLDFDGEIERYVRRWRVAHPGAKKGPLVDCPHFQTIRIERKAA